MAKLNYFIEPTQHLFGQIKISADKSISQRALLLGSIAQGETKIYNCLQAGDTQSLIQALVKLGIEITSNAEALIITGKGKYGYIAPESPLDLGNSATGMRLLTAIIAGQGIRAVLTGDASLCQRPMKRIIEPLTAMGANLIAEDNASPPLTIQPGRLTKPIHYSLPMASAQVKTAVLLAGLYTPGLTSVTEPLPTRDHTERMLPSFGVSLDVREKVRSIRGPQDLRATQVRVPGDLSSAAFFIVAACICKSAHVILTQVGINPSRLGIIHLLRRMGAKLRLVNINWYDQEPIADIEVYNSKLKGITITAQDVALAIDELPVLCIAAACASGETRISGAVELRAKESDRLKAMACGLSQLGIKLQELPDGLVIQGGRIAGAKVDSFGDHRVAMAFSIAAIAASGPIEVENCANVATSLPNFIDLARQIGLFINRTNV